mgnify:CR=1 FL=1
MPNSVAVGQIRGRTAVAAVERGEGENQVGKRKSLLKKQKNIDQCGKNGISYNMSIYCLQYVSIESNRTMRKDHSKQIRGVPQ